MKPAALVAMLAALFLIPASALAHFGMLIPSDTMVKQQDKRIIHMDLAFAHPFEQVGMELVKPKSFDVYVGENEKSLLNSLSPRKYLGHGAWQADYKISRPGLYTLVMEPTPYWEPAEDCFIVHITKAVVTAFGDDDGWDRELGLDAEIVPLSKPFGLYAGNVFQGIVKFGGKPVPFCEVEVEYLNDKGDVKAPTEYMVTQTIKADENGVFTYAAPAPGWWGFAALHEAPYKLDLKGEKKDVEMGAVIWVKFLPFGKK